MILIGALPVNPLEIFIMPSISIKYNDVFNLAAACQAIQGEVGLNFFYAIGKNQVRLQDEVRILNGGLAHSKKYKEFLIEQTKLNVKHCLKDDDKKPILIKGAFQGLKDNPEYEKDLDKLKKKFKDSIKKREKQVEINSAKLQEYFDFETYPVKFDIIPDDMIVGQISAVARLITDDSEFRKKYMTKVKLSRIDWLNILNGMGDLRELKGSEFGYAMGLTTLIIQAEPEIAEYEKKRLMLCQDHCQRDGNEEPLVADGKYVGLDDNYDYLVAWNE